MAGPRDFWLAATIGLGVACHDRAMNWCFESRRHRLPMRQRRMPTWAALLLLGAVLLLLYPAMFDVRYGAGWAVAWELVQCAWLPLFFVEPARSATWLRRHLYWAFSYVVLILGILFFGFIVLSLGVWLSPWWCLAIAVGAAALTVARLWPTQLRFYKLQESLSETERWPRASVK